MSSEKRWWGSKGKSTLRECAYCGGESEDCKKQYGEWVCTPCRDSLNDAKGGGVVVSTSTMHFSGKSCKHSLSPFTFSDKTVYLSAVRDREKKPNSKPTAGLYLDNQWVVGQVFASDRGTSGAKIMYLAWPDMGVVGMSQVHQACRWAKHKIEGGSRLEIGCIGGHGRTGTMMACIMVYYGWNTRDAIHSVRGYCSKAIETEKQEKMIEEFETWLQSR